MNRRTFIARSALAAGTLVAVPEWMRAWSVERTSPVRIRGRVVAAGKGLARVAVTDGLMVTDTDSDGRFELVSNTRQSFVYLSLPAGYRIPQQETGTARFFEPIPSNVEEMEVVFELEPEPQSDEHHAFLVLADPQTKDAYDMGLLHKETVPDVQQTIRGLGDVPLFGVSCGDIMYDDLSLYPEYERAVAQMGIPFFQVVGNHDLDFDAMTDRASAHTFCRHFGPAYYSFNRGAVHYVVLDDVFWNADGYFGYLDADQLTWLEADLSRVEPGQPVVVFVHIPAQSTGDARRGRGKISPVISITNREILYRLLEPFQAHVISGHTHECEHVFEGGVHEHVCGAVCGAWWTGPICYDGAPGGYAVFEARGEELRWRYKGTGLPADHQMRLYARGTDPRAPDEFIANVWDWDPAWTVTWEEDGIRKGHMARRVGTDPLSEQLHRGDDKPERRSWVEPIPTAHLFYAPVSPDAGTVRVEATNRWGQTFTATL